MNHDASFVLSRYQNRIGVTSWRVSGQLAGVCVRRNFPTREDAAVERAALERRALQCAGGGVRSATTFLTDDQLREAEAAFRRLAGAARPLACYLDFALANYREPEREKGLAEAVAAYLASKRLEHERTILSGRQLGSIENELGIFLRHFPSGALVVEAAGLIGRAAHRERAGRDRLKGEIHAGDRARRGRGGGGGGRS